MTHGHIDIGKETFLGGLSSEQWKSLALIKNITGTENMFAALITFSFQQPLELPTNERLPTRCIFKYIGKSNEELLKVVVVSVCRQVNELQSGKGILSVLHLSRVCCDP